MLHRTAYGVRRAIACLIAALIPTLASAQATAPKSYAGGEPVEFSTTPEGLPAEELQVRDFDFSPDGLLLATAYGRWTTTGVVRVYEFASKKLVQTLPLPKGATAVDFSPDGRWLGASCWDHKVYVWDTAGYQPVATMVGGTKAVRAAFSPDSKWLGVASEAGELTLWDTGNWQEAKKFTGDLFRFQHLAFSPDGKLLCAVGGSFENPRFGRAVVFEVETGKQRHVINAGNQPLGGVAFSPDGQTIAAGGFDGVVHLWDAGKQRLAMTDPLGGGGTIERLAFSPDGKTIAAGYADSMLRLWSTSDGSLAARLQQPAYVLGVAYSPDGSKLASGGDDKIVHILDAKKQAELFTLHPLSETADVPSAILALAASRDGRFLATAHEDLSVRLRDAASGKVLRALNGHTDVVAAVAFSPDCKRLATASYDRTVKLWTLEVESAPQTLTGHTNWVFAVEFSADGSRLATSGYDKTVRLWDAATGKQLNQFTGHTATVRSVAFSRDGQKLVSGSADRTARIWDLAGPGTPIELKGHEAAIRAVAFAPDGATVATAGEDNSVRIWDAATGKPLRKLDGHTNMVWCLAFSPGGRTLASGGFDNSVRVWNPQTGKPLQELKGHTDVVAALVYTADSRALVTASYDKTLKRWASKAPPVPPLADLQVADDGGARFGFVTRDGKTLVTGNNNGYVKFWDLATGEMLKAVKQPRGMAGGEMSRDGTRLITSGYGSQVYLWDLVGQRQLAAIEIGHPESIAVAISADNTRIAAGGNDGAVAILDAITHTKLHELPGDGLPLGGVEFSPDGTLLATATGNYKEWQKPGSVKLWDVETGREVAALPGTKSKMRRVRFTADGGTLLACGSQNEVLVYDVPKRTLKYTIPTDDEISDIAILPDRRTLALGQFKGIVSLYDLQDKKKIGEFDGHRDAATGKYVFGVSASPDGSVVISAAGDSHVKLWSLQPPTDTATALKLVAEVRDDEAESFAVAFSPDGKQLASGAKDKTIKLRDAKSLELQRTFTGHNSLIFRLAFHPQRNWLASGSSDGTVRIWDLADGKWEEMKAHGDKVAQVRSLAFSPDGKLLAAGNWDGEVYVWAGRKLVYNLTKQSLPVTGLAFSPDGALLATCTGTWQDWQKPGEVRLWNVRTGEELAKLDGPTAELKGVCFNRSGTHLLAYGLNKQVLVWDATKRSPNASFNPELGITAATVLAGDRLVAVGDIKGNVSIRELETGRVIASADGSGKLVSSLALSADGVLAAAGLDGMLRTWQTAETQPADASAVRTLAQLIRGWPAKGVAAPSASAGSAVQAVAVRELAPHGQQVWFAVYSPNGSLLATGGSDRTVKIWDTATFEQKCELKGHSNYITHGAWSPDGKRLVTAGWDKRLGLWDIEQQKLINLWEAHDMGIRKVAWSPDGRSIASAGEEGKVGLWDAESFSQTHLIEIGLPAYSVAFSPDGKTLAVGSGDYKTKANGRISLWDPATAKRLGDVEGSIGYVFHLAYLSADRLLAANAGEGVAVWNLETGMLETAYRAAKDVRWLEASRDGKRIVAAHYDGKSWISVWDRDTTKPLVTFNGHEDFGFTAAFTPDGKQIVSGAGDGKLKVWELKPAGQTAAKGEGK